jgi:hypothetical protein
MRLPDIDDKYSERAIKILAGRELVAQKLPWDKYWMVKVVGCNLCGECCMDNPNTCYGVNDEGKCNALVQFGDTWECSAGDRVPYNCLDDPVDIDICSIRHKWVKVK